MSAGAFKTSDGCGIAYRVREGNGTAAPRIALIHSLAMDASFWDDTIAFLPREAAVLSYDCRGHGKSDAGAGGYTAHLFARDLAELLDHLGWDRACIAGCSMGGCVAQAFAALHPQRVTALALFDTTAWYGADAPKTWRERGAAGREKGLASMVEFSVTRWFGDAFRAAQPARVEAATRVFLANSTDCYAATCEMLGNADLRDVLPALAMPVAIVVGEEDYATPVAMSRQLHEAIAGSTLTVLPGARHLTPIERPRDIAAQLEALLARAKP
jgi:3-oxoadipate enol-lactonase